ncbi:MAG: DoxX family protein [Myxococcota bacterium]
MTTTTTIGLHKTEDLMTALHSWAPLFGRACLSVIFIMSGVGKLAALSATAGHMRAEGMFAVPLFLFLAIFFELAGGLSILLGFGARWGALALFCFLIPVTYVFHDFWTYEGMERQMQTIQLMKNLAIMGGLTFVFTFGSGPKSLDAARGQTSTK